MKLYTKGAKIYEATIPTFQPVKNKITISRNDSSNFASANSFLREFTWSSILLKMTWEVYGALSTTTVIQMNKNSGSEYCI